MNKYIGKNNKGNCIKIMSKIPNGKINLILTDPPYNASRGGISLPNNKTGGAYFKINEKWDMFGGYSDYINFTRSWINKADKLLTPNGSIMVCCSFHNIGEIIIVLKELNYKFINLITWKKANPMPNITKRMLTHSTEFVVWFSKDKGWTFNYNEMKKYNQGKQLKDVWEFPLVQGFERIKGEDGKTSHPTQKPLKLFRRLIEMGTNKGDIVLDPFIGIGTTAIAAKELDRKWIGIEINKKYIEIANKRIKKHFN
ncbi:MAG: site-specific DNA-methyltransferase [Candidatus Firestonebacteria bacterium]